MNATVSLVRLMSPAATPRVAWCAPPSVSAESLFQARSLPSSPLPSMSRVHRHARPAAAWGAPLRASQASALMTTFNPRRATR